EQKTVVEELTNMELAETKDKLKIYNDPKGQYESSKVKALKKQ
ncbi:7370_t:CDS:2, partial [Gigaspora rosea]